MSQENVKVVRDGLDAVNRRDAEAFLRAADPKIEDRGDLVAFGVGDVVGDSVPMLKAWLFPHDW